MLNLSFSGADTSAAGTPHYQINSGNSMKTRTLAITTTVIIGLAVMYFAGVWYSGNQIARQVDTGTEFLIARDDVQVTRIEYQREFFGGELHYDMIYHPMEGSAQHELLALVEPQGQRRLQGVLPVRHGPVVHDGQSLTFGAASVNADFLMPDEWRQWLPQYPGQAPLLRVDSVVSLGGELTTHARLVDYQGRLRLDGEPSDLTLNMQSVRARFDVNQTLDRVRAELAIEELQLTSEADAVDLRLHDFDVEMDQQLSMPYLWTGYSQLLIDELALQFEDEHMELQGVQLRVDSEIEDGMLALRQVASLDSLRVQEEDFGQSRLAVSLQRLDAAAASDLMMILEQVSLYGAPTGTQPFEQQMTSIGDRFLAAHPRLSIDELATSLANTLDTRGSLSVQYTGPANISDWDMSGLPAYFQLQANASTTEPAIARFASVDALTGMGFQQTGETLSVALRLEDNQLWVNDEPAPEFQEIIEALAMIALGNADASPQSASLPVLQDGELQDRGYALQLESGFLPDPVEINVMAGGPERVSGNLGLECVGYTYTDSPNVLLEYTAGSFPLYIAAFSSLDTALLVRDPNGAYHCNDDAIGLDPMVVIEQPQSGLYEIWVSSYEPGEDLARMLISEIGEFETGPDQTILFVLPVDEDLHT